jgi:hydroxymethylpyrimidine/phosphomethylpyrimidine kinase
MRYPTALTIAGSDSGGCAGIQADLKTFSSIGVFGATVITAITAQNTQEVRAVDVLSPMIVKQQIEAVFDDIIVDAVKTGMLPSAPIIEIVASAIDKYEIPSVVIDPVMVATSGARLTSASTISAFRELLYPRLSLITPNIPEAETLSGIKIKSDKDIYKAADILLAQGCNAVLIKGGHLKSDTSPDILFCKEKEPVLFSSPYINSLNLHGTGCTLASAITAYIALGRDLENAVGLAKSYITSSIYKGKDIVTGKGNGPVNHFFEPQSLKIINI